jgi:hypothetical protein
VTGADTAKRKWDMSPGYDAAGHWSFERPVRIGCGNQEVLTRRRVRREVPGVRVERH